MAWSYCSDILWVADQAHPVAVPSVPICDNGIAAKKNPHCVPVKSSDIQLSVRLWIDYHSAFQPALLFLPEIPHCGLPVKKGRSLVLWHYQKDHDTNTKEILRPLFSHNPEPPPTLHWWHTRHSPVTYRYARRLPARIRSVWTVQNGQSFLWQDEYTAHQTMRWPHDYPI